MSRVSRTDYSGDRIAKLEKQIQGIQDDIKGIKGDLDGMARMHNALKSRVEALENKK